MDVTNLIDTIKTHIIFINTPAFILCSTGLFVIISLVYIGIIFKKKKVRIKEMKTQAMLDSINLKKSVIYTDIIQNMLFNVVTQVVKSTYYQSAPSVPIENINVTLLNKVRQQIIKELEYGIKRNIENFDILELDISEQNNSLINVVSTIEVKGRFLVKYHEIYYNAYSKLIEKKFDQKFIFSNCSKCWELSFVSSEDIILILENDDSMLNK